MFTAATSKKLNCTDVSNEDTRQWRHALRLLRRPCCVVLTDCDEAWCVQVVFCCVQCSAVFRPLGHFCDWRQSVILCVVSDLSDIFLSDLIRGLRIILLLSSRGLFSF